MKYTFIAVLFALIAFKASSQTIDTSFHYCKAAKIENLVLQVNYPDYDTCTHLGVIKVEHDYTTCKTNITYYLGNKSRNVKGGVYVIDDADDRSIGDILGILQYNLNVTFK